MTRVYTPIAKSEAKKELQNLLSSLDSPENYKESMVALGSLLAEEAVPILKESQNSDVLVVSTAEDADFLQRGVSLTLKKKGINTKLAVFWNHHYQTSTKTSVAPIIHRFIEPNYESIHNIIIVKSIISGSCVVRTNLIEMLDKINNIENIFILAPVAHEDSEDKLKAEFPIEISNKFKFYCFAIDDEKTENGEVQPGIGGQIYELLGLGNQPALTGYIPDVVMERSFSSAL